MASSGEEDELLIGGMRHSPWSVLAEHSIASRGGKVHLSLNHTSFWGDTVLPSFKKMHSYEICCWHNQIELSRKAKWYRPWRLLLCQAEILFYHGTYERFSHWGRYLHYFILSSTTDTRLSILGRLNMLVYMDWVMCTHSQPLLASIGLNPERLPELAPDVQEFEKHFWSVRSQMNEQEQVLTESLLTGLLAYLDCGTCPRTATAVSASLSADLLALSRHGWYVQVEFSGPGHRGRYLTSLFTVSYTHLRAHETPEHLVCRLLLEKKKRNRYRMKYLLRKKKIITNKYMKKVILNQIQIKRKT
eukprot:TRINITY_DN16881_c0_g1_i3.p1 TRINITY_DN16881_c0_g1~~TRINITY_DN16881_c0_g1_i3.p1  ORF type:complete len:303 (-),score=43.30 TRINITY_DN16881_c0_g1_i3:18-926(-)